MSLFRKFFFQFNMPELFAYKLVTYKEEGYIQNIDPCRRVTSGGRGRRSPLPFFKNLEKVP